MNAERVSEHIVSWLKNYAINAKVNGFVIGISGGIDSAVTSKLCAKTGLKLICVEMPIHQAERQVSRALEHINNLKNDFNNVTSVKVDLTSTFEEFKIQVPDSENKATL
ncbi:MAG: NAD(+) synthase, partial [Polaribacter sp.]|nr:NAD(+) synthase [Polaribacter sp.]